MGLIINGNINGKSYSDQMVSADEVLEIFKLKEEFARLGKVLRFDLDESKLKKAGGEILHPQQEAIMCTTNGTINGDNFELIYFKTRTRISSPSKGTGVEYNLNPRKILIVGMSHMVNLMDNKEMGVFMYLHQSCVESPVRHIGSRVIYTVHDSERKSKEAFKKNRLIMDVYEELMKGNIMDLRLKAQGLRLGNMTKKEDDIVRMELVAHFEKMKQQGKMNKFIEEFNAPYSMFTGLVMEAINRAILQQKQGKGRFEYVWGPGTDMEGNVACVVPAGEQPVEALIKYAHGNYEYFLSKIDGEIQKDKKREKLGSYLERIKNRMNEPNEITDEEIVEIEALSAYEMGIPELIVSAVEHDCIEYNRKTKEVYLVAKGELEEDACFIPKEGEDWKEAFTDFLNDDKNSDLLKTIRQKLNGHLSLSKKKAKSKK